jgi:cob(I)alamin adenosyltransferase
VGLKEGFVQVYTGNGKGKSTAAIGLAVRAAGAGLKSYIIQFMKDYNYSELRSLELLHEFIELEKVGKDDFVFRKELPPQEEIDLAATALNKAEIKMLSGKYDIIILDEACVSIYFKILKEEQILEFINKKPKEVELVITGRYCPKSIIDKADLVTEMKEINHYYQKGIVSRKGIDF